MKNVIVTQGLKITTNNKYVKFTEADTTRVVNRVQSSTLEILFKKCRKSSDIVGSGIDLIEDKVLEETDYKEIKNPIIRINDFYFRKIVDFNFSYSQFIVEDISQFVIYKNSSQLIVLIPTNRLKDYKGFVQAVISSCYLEYLRAGSCPLLSNIKSQYISDVDLCVSSSNTTAIKTSKAYDGYLVKSVDVFYEYLTGLSKRLEAFGMSLVGYPIDETPPTSNYIRWKLTEKDKRVQRVTGAPFLSHAVQTRATMQMEACFSDFKVFEDFCFKYQHYTLITNYTEFYVTDIVGTKWLCSALYSTINTDFDNSSTESSEGTFSYTKTFTVDLYYYIVEDAKAFKLYNIIKQVTADERDPLL